MRVTGVVEGRQIQAVAVQFTDTPGVECSNGVPHIIVSSGIGVPACRANELLVQYEGINIRPCAQILLDGTVGCLVDLGKQQGSKTQQRIVDRGEFARVAHCPRTFQLVKELAGYIIHNDVRVELSDELVAQAVDHMAGLSHQDWVYLFGDFVHENYVDSLVGGIL